MTSPGAKYDDEPLWIVKGPDGLVVEIAAYGIEIMVSRVTQISTGDEKAADQNTALIRARRLEESDYES